jgi:hypothetical protein
VRRRMKSLTISDSSLLRSSAFATCSNRSVRWDTSLVPLHGRRIRTLRAHSLLHAGNHLFGTDARLAALEDGALVLLAELGGRAQHPRVAEVDHGIELHATC